MSRLLDLIVTEISLVRRPANRRGVILRQQASTQHQHWFDITRAEPQWQRLYGIVYAPNEVDTQGDWADANTIRAAATEFMQRRRQKNVDREHDFEHLDDTFVAETWLTRAGDPLFPDDPPGTWAVGIQVNDPELWAEILAGELAGLSLAGMALLGDDDLQKSRPKTLLTSLREIFQRKARRVECDDDDFPNQEVDDMTADEVRALVREVLTEARKDEDKARQEAQTRGELTRLAAENEALKTDMRVLNETATALKTDLEQLKTTPAGAKGTSEQSGGAPAHAAASFV